jgi:hypothetical protein
MCETESCVRSCLFIVYSVGIRIVIVASLCTVASSTPPSPPPLLIFSSSPILIASPTNSNGLPESKVVIDSILVSILETTPECWCLILCLGEGREEEEEGGKGSNIQRELHCVWIYFSISVSVIVSFEMSDGVFQNCEMVRNAVCFMSAFYLVVFSRIPYFPPRCVATSIVRTG